MLELIAALSLSAPLRIDAASDGTGCPYVLPGSRCYHTRINNCLNVPLKFLECQITTGTQVTIPKQHSVLQQFDHSIVEADAPGVFKPTTGSCVWTYSYSFPNGTMSNHNLTLSWEYDEIIHYTSSMATTPPDLRKPILGGTSLARGRCWWLNWMNDTVSTEQCLAATKDEGCSPSSSEVERP